MTESAPLSGTAQPRSIYVDNAATSFPRPVAVYDAVNAQMRQNGAAAGRGSHAGSEAADRILEQCRRQLASILDSESPDRIAFTFNCTDGLNLLLRGLLRDGDRVVTTTLEHNSVLRPLQQLQKEMSLEIVKAGFAPATGLVDVNEITAALNQKPTRLVVLNHASNVTGVVQPVSEVAEAAHRSGALLLVDAAQTVGHLSFSVQDSKIDLLAAAGHKGLLGPLGTGIVYVRDGLDDQLRPIRCGGTGTSSESLDQPLTMPAKLESGNMNVPGIAGLGAAAEWLKEQGIENLHNTARCLTRKLAAALAALPGLRIFGGCAKDEDLGIVSFTVAGLDSREVAAILDQSFDIRCRAGLHCAPLVHETLGTLESGGTVRFSVGPFLSESDIETVVAAVGEIAAI